MWNGCGRVLRGVVVWLRQDERREKLSADGAPASPTRVPWHAQIDASRLPSGAISRHAGTSPSPCPCVYYLLSRKRFFFKKCVSLGLFGRQCVVQFLHLGRELSAIVCAHAFAVVRLRC